MSLNRSLSLSLKFGILLLCLACQEQQEPQPIEQDPCKMDPCANPDLCVCENIFSELDRDSFKPKGAVTESEDGFSVDGQLSFKTRTDSITFEDASLTTVFSPTGTLQSMSGTTQVPDLAGYFSFPNPVTADVGYFSGKYLNENREFDILLIDTISYFVFNIQVNVAVKFGNPSDPDVTPLTLSVPVGGHITLLANYDDPFFYFSLGQDLIGGLRMGGSGNGYIPFVPLQPIKQVEGFGGRKLQGGVFTVFKVLVVNGTVIEYGDVRTSPIDLENPVPENITAEYRSGLNGSFSLSLPIKSKTAKVPFLQLSMPIAEASAAITTIGDLNSIQGKAFINGVLAADNSWWPDFIPLKFGAERRAWGFIQQDGLFEIGNSGKFFIEVPGKNHSTEGSIIYTNESATYSGTVTENSIAWKASAVVEEGATTFLLDPPMDFTNGLSNRVNARIDHEIDEVIARTRELDEAVTDYEFELSLRGLRKDLPGICDNARTQLTAALNKAVADARAAIDKELANASPLAMKRCDDNLPSVIFKAAEPYFSAIDQLKTAANETKDNETTRQEIEAALRGLVARKRLKQSVSGSVKAATQLAGCSFGAWGSRSVSLDIQVIGEGVVNQLQSAADHVKFIQETSDTVVTLQQVVDGLPLQEDLEKLKQDLHSGVKQIPTLDNVGFVKYYDPVRFEFFATLSGKQEVVGEFDIFDGEAVVAFLVRKLQ